MRRLYVASTAVATQIVEQSDGTMRFSLSIILFAAFLGCLAGVYCQEVDLEENTDMTNARLLRGYRFENDSDFFWLNYVIGGAFIIVAFPLAFFGLRLLKPTLCIVVVLMVLNVVWTLFEQTTDWHPGAIIAMVAVIAVVAGLIGCMIVPIGLLIMGAYGGFLVAHWFMALLSTIDVLAPSQVVVIVFLVIGAVIGTVLSLFFSRPFFLVWSSLVGAYYIVLGVDIILSSVLGDFLLSSFLNKVVAGTVSAEDVSEWIWLELVCFLALFLLALVTQWRATAPDAEHDHLPDLLCGACHKEEKAVRAAPFRDDGQELRRRRSGASRRRQVSQGVSV